MTNKTEISRTTCPCCMGDLLYPISVTHYDKLNKAINKVTIEFNESRLKLK